jgi:NitT/TauT family transport system permease protein
MSSAALASNLKLHHRLLDTLMLLLFVVASWQILHLIAGDVALPSPATTVRRAAGLVLSGQFWGHVQGTMWAFILGLIIAVGGGLIIGLSLGSNRLLGEVFEPGLMAFYTVPKVAFFPVILLICGIGLAAQVVFGVIHGIVPVAIFTMNAVRNVRPVFLKTARIHRLSSVQIWWKIILPSSLPEVFSSRSIHGR